MKFTGQGQDQS